MSIEANEILRALKVFAHMHAVDVGAGGRQHHACRVPYPVGPLGFHDDAVRGDFKADAVLLAEGGGVGEVRAHLADPQPVGARPLDAPTDGIADQVHRIADRDELQFSQLHDFSPTTPRCWIAGRRRPAAAGRPR